MDHDAIANFHGLLFWFYAAPPLIDLSTQQLSTWWFCSLAAHKYGFDVSYDKIDTEVSMTL